MALQCKDSENQRETPPFEPPYVGGTTAGHSGDGESNSSSPPPLPPSDRRADDENQENEEEEEDEKNSSDLQTSTSTTRMLRPRGQGAEKEENKEKKKTKTDFHVTLSKEEIEEDFILMTGFKPPRRPKYKHKSSVQNRLNSLFPGLHLPETITSDRYEFSDELH